MANLFKYALLGNPPSAENVPSRDLLIEALDEFEQSLLGDIDDKTAQVSGVLEGSISGHDQRIVALEGFASSGFAPVQGGPVDVATTGAITLSGEKTIDGVITSGSRVLVKDQADASENGVYDSASGAWSRVADLNEPAEFAHVGVFVVSGAENAGRTYVCNSTVTTVESDPITWVHMRTEDASDKVGYSDGIDKTPNPWPMMTDANGKPVQFYDPATGQIYSFPIHLGGWGNGTTLEARESGKFLRLQAGNMVYLDFDEHGRMHAVPNPEMLDQIAHDLAGRGVYDPVASGLVPSLNVDVFGDSMANSNFSNGIAAEYGAGTVTRRNYGGQTTDQLAIIHGLKDTLTVTLSGDEIPASGAVAVTSKSTNILFNGGYSGTVSVTISGVEGIISTDGSGNWTFTRNASGSVVAVAPDTTAFLTKNVGTSFIPAPDSRLGQVQVFRMGRNGRPSNRAEVVAYADLICGMIDRLTPRKKQCLVYPVYHQNLSTSPERDADLAWCQEANYEVHRRIGDMFLDGALEWAVKHAIYDIGLTPDATDLSHMNDGHIPPQVFSDNTHMISDMSAAEGKLVADAIKSGKGM